MCKCITDEAIKKEVDLLMLGDKPIRLHEVVSAISQKLRPETGWEFHKRITDCIRNSPEYKLVQGTYK